MDYEFWIFFGSILKIQIDTNDFLEVWKFCFYCCYLPKMNVLRDYTSLDWGNDFSEQPFQVKERTKAESFNYFIKIKIFSVMLKMEAHKKSTLWQPNRFNFKFLQSLRGIENVDSKVLSTQDRENVKSVKSRRFHGLCYDKFEQFSQSWWPYSYTKG